MLTALIHLVRFKISMAVASKFRRKKKLTPSDWLSGYSICDLLGRITKVKTGYDTHIISCMKLVKDFISTSKIFCLWQWEKMTATATSSALLLSVYVHPGPAEYIPERH